jgi:hypothetical protein
MRAKVLLRSLLASLLVCGYPSIVSVQAKQPVQLAQLQWKEFSSKEGSFTVLMPGTPMQKKTSMGGEVLSIDGHIFKVALENDSVSYTVCYADFPSEVAQLPTELLLSSVTSALSSQKDLKVLSEQDIRLGSYPGKEFRLENPGKAIVRHRVYWVKQRVYQVAVETPVDRVQALSSDVDRFFNSFQVLK